MYTLNSTAFVAVSLGHKIIDNDLQTDLITLNYALVNIKKTVDENKEEIMKSYTDLSSPVVARWMCVCKKKQNKKYMVTI